MIMFNEMTLHTPALVISINSSIESSTESSISEEVSHESHTDGRKVIVDAAHCVVITLRIHISRHATRHCSLCPSPTACHEEKWSSFWNHDLPLQIQINFTFFASFSRPWLHLDFFFNAGLVDHLLFIQSDSITHHRCPTGSRGNRPGEENCQPLTK